MSEENSTSLSRVGLSIGVLGALLLGLWAFSQRDLSAGETESPDGEGVLATVGDLTISEEEVRDKVASGLRDLDQKRHQLMERGLEQVVQEKLIELGAQARGLSSDAFMAQEVDSKTSAVTDEQVSEFFEQRKTQINQPLEQVADQIRDFLAQQQKNQIYSGVIDGLRAEYAVSTYLEPLRVEMAASGPAKGPANAPVTIVEFSDFQCPFCSRVVPTLDRVTADYGDKVRLVFRQFPLSSIHPEAQKAAEASLCANEQDKFWEMHDALFAAQRELSIEGLTKRAGEIELDTEKFAECLGSDRYAKQVEQDLLAGQAAGVTGTPALFINGRFLSGAQPYDVFAKVIDDELRRAGE